MGKKHSLTHLSVLDAHEVVQDGVDGGGNVVEDAGDVHEVLIGRAEEGGILQVDVAQSLRVEGQPAEEEGDHHHG